jgi:hypothetical protein
LNPNNIQINEEFLASNNVSSKITNILFDIYKADIPKPPTVLKEVEDGPKYYALNEFYALKIILKQHGTPSGAKAYDLIKGNTRNVYERFRTLKALLPMEFEPEEKDESNTARALMKKDLLKTETAIFKAELADQESLMADQIINQAQDYEKQIERLNESLCELKGQNKVLLELSKEHRGTIDSLQSKLKNNEVNLSELHNIKILAEERKQSLKEKNDSFNKLFESFEHQKESEAARFRDILNEKGRAESREQITLRELTLSKEANTKFYSDRELHLDEISELNSKVQQISLEIESEHSKDLLLKQLSESLEPLNKLGLMLELASKVTKKDKLDISGVERSISDISTNMLNMNESIKKLTSKIKN